MEKEIVCIAIEYAQEVEKVCRILLKSFNVKTKKELLEQRIVYPSGVFGEDKKCSYYFHGRGMHVSYGENELDFDFGMGESWCGLNPWFLSNYIDNKKYGISQKSGFEIERIFEKKVESGEMVKGYGLFYFKN